LYVKDTVDGFLKISQSDSLIGHDCNIATQSEISVEDLANELINQINPNAKIVSDEQRIRPFKSEVFRLYGSNQKLKDNTDWELRYSFKQGIAETIEWFRQTENFSKYKPEIYNI
jgi:nucleoside-diphosphate-sugar epimerase